MGSTTTVSSLALIKDGAQKPPVFICHGLSGTVQFSDLVKHIHTGQPVYAIQASGIDGLESPLSTVEEMADYHFDALQELDLEQSWVLIGTHLADWLRSKWPSASGAAASA